MLNQLQRFVNPIYRRMAVLLSKGIMKAINDGTNLPLVKVALGAGELRDNLEYLQQYGFTSVPEAGAEALVGFIGGNRDNGVVILLADSRTRKKGLAAGDVCIYRKGGAFVHLKDNNVIEIHAKNVDVTLETGGQFSVAGSNLTVDAS